ncbi:MAG: GNAT family N-acetyltransferase [Methanimicrococcus sp.]|nr:GNAT family N-acetyltransferase [Methanimicrococcus sp.]
MIESDKNNEPDKTNESDKSNESDKNKNDVILRFAEKTDALAIDIILSTYFLDRDDIPYEHFRVAEKNGKIIGCAAFEKSETPAEKETFFEIHTIAVLPPYKGKGYGKRLLAQLISDIQSLPEAKGINKIYTRTTAPDFFIREGFEKADIDRKQRWSECVRCDKIDICSQTILVKKI